MGELHFEKYTTGVIEGVSRHFKTYANGKKELSLFFDVRLMSKEMVNIDVGELFKSKNKTNKIPRNIQGLIKNNVGQKVDVAYKDGEWDIVNKLQISVEN